jgi:hypothetical protein
MLAQLAMDVSYSSLVCTLQQVQSEGKGYLPVLGWSRQGIYAVQSG